MNFNLNEMPDSTKITVSVQELKKILKEQEEEKFNAIEDLYYFLKYQSRFGFIQLNRKEMKHFLSLCENYNFKYGCEFDYEDIFNKIVGRNFK